MMVHPSRRPVTVTRASRPIAIIPEDDSLAQARTRQRHRAWRGAQGSALPRRSSDCQRQWRSHRTNLKAGSDCACLALPSWLDCAAFPHRQVAILVAFTHSKPTVCANPRQSLPVVSGCNNHSLWIFRMHRLACSPGQVKHSRGNSIIIPRPPGRSVMAAHRRELRLLYADIITRLAGTFAAIPCSGWMSRLDDLTPPSASSVHRRTCAAMTKSEVGQTHKPWPHRIVSALLAACARDLYPA